MRAVLLTVLLNAALSLVVSAQAQAQPPSPTIAVHFCPKTRLRPYPLDASGRMQGLLLQAFTVVNEGEAPVKLDEISISMLVRGQVIDTRALNAADLDRWGVSGPPIQNVMKKHPQEYCSESVVPGRLTLGGPTLKRDQALIVAQEVFAYDRPRDELRVSVRGTSGDRPVVATVSIPIESGFAKSHFRFPLSGNWYVGVGPGFYTAHRTHPYEEFALDISQLGQLGRTYSGDGLSFRDYYAYGAPVLAAADGRVVRAHDGQAENPAALQRPGETADAYLARHASELDAETSASNADWAAGNFVMLDHGGGEYSLYAHLQPGSVSVKVGDQVRAGSVLGKLGSSGNSSEPHLHFQVCDRPDPLRCAGLPVAFENLAILWADAPRALQSGDIVTAR